MAGSNVVRCRCQVPSSSRASVKAVQAQLGHATASITLDTYGHLFPSELEALADRLEQVERPPWRTGSGPSADQPS